MKHCFLFIGMALAMMATSCISQPEFYHSTAYLDYQKYSDEGFFITESMSAPFEYSSVGSISVDEVSGVDKTSTQRIAGKNSTMDEMDGVYVKRPKKSDKYRYATAESAIDAVVQRAKAVGANGIIGLRITPGKTTKNIPYVNVSGMLIKR